MSKEVFLKNKDIIIVIVVIISIFAPFFIQGHINTLFRDVFNPSGCIVLKPYLRVISTLVCFFIVYGIGLYLLMLVKSRRLLFILHAILTFLWCVFIAIFVYAWSMD